ncbi:PREDICTED: glycerophosphodiester phosphodiesterase 1-like [Amphimedon queenslandica]|uniref:GP-PDE domain-containing protein n=1 Tax=Amphimedon queenslandica TaxID=400682 RepID=A0A1X7UBQ7_AMPQE|nr:PREDICTED: glycerophosphodiester phosphodiesterase 1-like [Amphimedon queenslandica]|eukprot:XP_003388501.3 PREDICTED: glycerophosphodiester phosphodiesterase 1-like [Amphimedon queenslandica]
MQIFVKVARWKMNPLALRIISSFTYFVFVVPCHFLFRGFLARNSLSKLDYILEGIKKGPIAHRGGIPENTLTAFRKSKTAGATAVEVDLQMTRDGHPVLFHDDAIDRLCNGSGQLKDMTLEHIKTLDVDGHAKIPTLHEAISAIKELEMYMLLEVKCYNNQTVNIVTDLFKSDPELYERIVVISFFPHILYQIRRIDPDIIVGLVIRQTVFTVDPNNPQKITNKWKLMLLRAVDRIVAGLLLGFVRKVLGLSLILPHKVDILEERVDVKYFHKEGVRLVTWTVNLDEEKEYFSNVLQLPFMTDHVLSQELQQ